MADDRAVAVVVFNQQNQPVPNTTVCLSFADRQLFAVTNGDGYAVWSAPSNIQCFVQAWNPAYAYYNQPVPPLVGGNQTIRIGNSPSNPQDVILPPLSTFKQAPISKTQFRTMNPKGNFGGQVLPGLGLSTHDSIFDPMIPWYSADQQEAIFEAKRAAGLNTINLCSWSDYHGSQFGMPVRYDWTQGQAGAALARSYCQLLRSKGFLPAFWLLGDRWANDQYDPAGGHCDDALALIAQILPVIKDSIACCCPGYELRGCCGAAGAPYSAAQYWRMLILMNQIAPDLYKFGHFTSENSAGSSHSPVEDQDPWHGDEIGFWVNSDWPEGSSVAPTPGSTLLDGCFYQAPTGDKLFSPAGDWKDRWQEMIDRIGAGNHIWPPKCTDVDLIWGEAGWYDITRGDRTEQQLIVVSNQAMAMGGRWSFSG